MKKNVMMRVASIMLVLVLMSSSVISGTFAKYVTADDAGDTARVARFGVVATVDGTLFAKTYKNADDNTPGADDADGATVTVISQTAANVVAPGTKNAEGMTITLTGVPEVDVAVKFEFKVNDNKEIKLAAGTAFDDPTTGEDEAIDYVVAKDYYPVIFTLKNDKGETLASGNVKAIQDWLDSPVGLNKTYNAGTNLGDIGNGSVGEYTLTWEWAFENTVDAPDKVDVMDTYLGNAAAAKYFGATFPITGTELEMDVTFSLSVTQVD